MENVLGATVLLFGLAIGLAIGYFLGRKAAPRSASGPDPALERLGFENHALEQRLREASADKERFQGEAAQLQQKIVNLEKDLTRSETEHAALHRNTQENLRAHREEIARVQAQFQTQFENLANQALEKNTQKFQEYGEKSLQVLLNPLREKIQDFEKKVEDTYRTETRERFALKEELKRIVELNQVMTQEATNLTRALKADVKAQGNWGELILERLLTQSGLREGHEYTTQGQGLQLKTSEGEHQKPDVIINLPDGKHIIVDSKVSLKSYESYCNEQAPDQRAECLKQFMKSVYKHVDGLSAKHYAGLEGLRSPDVVLLFMPLEPAFALALQSDVELLTYAWGKRVTFVSPTTLLATLSTVASLWKTEHQNKNALEIARQGGALYDHFARFVADLEGIGKNLDAARLNYDEAFRKLRDGRGNLLNRVETLRKLGAKTTRELAAKYALDDDTATDTAGAQLALPDGEA